MQTTLRRLKQLGMVPALGLLALAASTGVTHADGPASGHHLPIVATNVATLTSIETGLQTGPGDVITLDGSNFGTQPGLVCLTWGNVVVQNSFTSGGQLCLSIQNWQPTRISAQVPSGVVGVPLEVAEVAVYPQGGTRSNSLTVGFYPTIETVQVNPKNDPSQGQPVTVNCSQNGSLANDCRSPIEDSCHGSQYFDFTGELGTDTFHLQLDNGWRVQGASLAIDSGFTNDGNATLTSAPASGAASGDFVVNWGLNGGVDIDSICYSLNISVSGPAGVPLQGQ